MDKIDFTKSELVKSDFAKSSLADEALDLLSNHKTEAVTAVAIAGAAVAFGGLKSAGLLDGLLPRTELRNWFALGESNFGKQASKNVSAVFSTDIAAQERAAIEGATKEVTMYRMSPRLDDDLLQSMIEARARGVSVEIKLAPGAEFASTEALRGYDRLLAAGVKVTPERPVFHHVKFGELVGSRNFSNEYSRNFSPSGDLMHVKIPIPGR